MEKGMKRILIIFGVIGLFIFLFQSNDFAEAKDPDYPTKPITFYIGFGAGGATDLASRAFVEAAGKHLGQPSGRQTRWLYFREHFSWYCIYDPFYRLPPV
jgi:hypothetical protein